MDDVEGLRSIEEIRESLKGFREQIVQMEGMFADGMVDPKTLRQQYALEAGLREKLFTAILEKGSGEGARGAEG